MGCFFQAIAHIEASTCIVIDDKTDDDDGYVLIDNRPDNGGCNANVGYAAHERSLNLADGCYVSKVV